MHDAAVNHQEEVGGKGAALPDAWAGYMFCALVVHGPDCEGWVVIYALYDVDVLLIEYPIF